MQISMTLPTSFVQAGISELGIYSNVDGALLMISTFPPFDQTDNAECEINYTIENGSILNEDGIEYIITRDGQKILLES